MNPHTALGRTRRYVFSRFVTEIRKHALVDTYFSLPTGTLKFSIKSAVHLKPLRIMGISLLCPFYRQGNREEETPGLATWNGDPGTCLRLSSEHFSLSRGYRWGLPAQL